MTATIPRGSRDGVDVGGTLTQALNMQRGFDGQTFYATDIRKLLMWDYGVRGWLPADGKMAYQAYAAGPPVVPRYLADDFCGSTIDPRYSIANGGGAAAASPAITAGVSAGECTLVTGTANGATACSALTLAAVWQPNQTAGWQDAARKQKLHYIGKVKVSNITSASFFIGFSDVLATNAATSQTPLTLTTATLAISGTNTGISNAVGFLFDTGATSKHIWAVASNAGVVATTPIDTSGVSGAPDIAANTYLYYKIEVDTSGNAQFWLAPVPTSGPPVWVSCGTISLAVAATAAMTPCAYVASRSATSVTLTLDLKVAK